MAKEEEQFHVVLIGIDGYAAPNTLQGCVNDIDRVQELLLGPGAKLDESCIRRLASPVRTATDAPATRANIRDALKQLAAKAERRHRVFVYYSGHGFRHAIKTPLGVVHREALVPVDFDRSQLLYDFELNQLLGDIAAKTSSLAVVLDCCHSAGVTRSPSDAAMVARSLTLPQGVQLDEQAAAAVGTSGLARGLDKCHVVSACLDHESAYESTAKTGMRNGLLTRALVEALGELKDLDLRTLSWAQVWQTVRQRVAKENAAQHVWMAGNPCRAFLAGPPIEGDAGFAISETNGGYTVHAGTLAGITKGAEIGVYDRDQPAFFPPIGSSDDCAKRITTLTITGEPTAATSPAQATKACKLPTGARGRLVTSAAEARLRCAIAAGYPEVVRAVKQSDLLDVVADGEDAPVRIVRVKDRWALIDDAHGLDAPRWPLFTFTGDGVVVRAVLEHYVRYILPIQMANRATDLPKQLELSLRACPKEAMSADEAQIASLPRALWSNGEYRLRVGDGVAFHVRNTTPINLRVTLVNCAATGCVQLLGDQVIDAHDGAHLFWLPGTVGQPFIVSVPAGAKAGTDRVVAIGRSTLDRELEFLRSDRNFSDIVTVTRGATNFEARPKRAVVPPDLWTAHQVIVRTCV